MRSFDYKEHKISDKDIKLMARAYLARAQRLTPANILVFILIIIILFLLLPGELIISIATSMLVFFLIFFVLIRSLCKKMVINMWRTVAPDGIIAIAVDNDGIAIRTAVTESFSSWRIVEDAMFVKDCVVLKYKHSAAMFFKESYFSPDDIAIIKSKVRLLESYFS